jgi:hypothetical protein
VKDVHVSTLGLSVRAYKALTRLGITALSQLVRITEVELRSARNCGITTVHEIKNAVEKLGYSLGTLHEPIGVGQSCQGCVYWKCTSSDNEGPVFGYCRRYPPTCSKGTENTQGWDRNSWFPETGSNDWCGEYKPCQ